MDYYTNYIQLPFSRVIEIKRARLKTVRPPEFEPNLSRRT